MWLCKSAKSMLIVLAMLTFTIGKYRFTSCGFYVLKQGEKLVNCLTFEAYLINCITIMQ